MQLTSNSSSLSMVLPTQEPPGVPHCLTLLASPNGQAGGSIGVLVIGQALLYLLRNGVVVVAVFRTGVCVEKEELSQLWVILTEVPFSTTAIVNTFQSVV